MIIRLTVSFSSSIYARSQWSKIFKLMTKKKKLPNIFHSGAISTRIGGKIKTFFECTTMKNAPIQRTSHLKIC